MTKSMTTAAATTELVSPMTYESDGYSDGEY
jgi:hypothetical protein